jgi:nitrous oxidase accessory protein
MHMQLHMQQDGTKLRKFLIVIIIMFILTNGVRLFGTTNLCQADTPPTLYVGPGETYSRIQDALDNVTADGYRIFVYNGTYYEHLRITHRIDLFGEDRSITIIDGNGSDTVITVNANVNNVNISHFTITDGNTSANHSLLQINGGHAIITDTIISQGYHGIVLNNSDNHLIYDNIIQDNVGDGIRLNHSDNNINISYNTITDNRNGIYLYSSEGNNIYNNDIKNNNKNGIFLNSTCQNNIIKHNNASDNDNHGIYLNDYSNYQTISNNKMYYNNNSGLVLENCSMNFQIKGNTVIGNINYGIMIVGSTNNISSNIISNNYKDGVYLSADDYNTLYQNTIAHNLLAGIRLYNSTHDDIHNNEISYNTYGAYLDFFTIDNMVYNNYFHDNTRNAMDKSLNRNKWNITQTVGANIVGGTQLCGNYWDDFDETSEGAIDNNADGIADSPYTIYTLNMDKGSLLDTTKPHIGTPTASPSTQTLGKYTNISVTVTDNTKVKGVYLNIINPSGQRSNTSITQNKTGNTYYCLKRFSPTGNYIYNITAKDPRNWEHSSNFNFSIRPGNPPTISDHSPITGTPSARFTFNATVTATDTLSSDLHVYAIWTHGNKGGNISLANTYGNYFVVNVTLAKSIANMTYYIYATDQWGNNAETIIKKVKVTDTKQPVIQINRYGPSFEDLPNSYTYGVTVTDDSAVSSVTIEYWYGSHNKMKVDMDAMGNSYYQKVIVPEGNPDRIYCIINASDIAGNSNNTKKPISSPGGPYRGFVLEAIRFNGTKSYDLDGTISEYSWNFGDGTSGNGSIATHTYYSNGTYTILLTVRDNDGKNGTNRTSIRIGSLSRHKIPVSQLDFINARYNISLSEQLFCYDSDGDGIPDTFVDPNHVLTAVHVHPVNMSGNTVFLLSIGDDFVPEFFWNITTDHIFTINHNIGIVQNIVVDDAKEQATVSVTVDKEQWIYIEVDDQYPNSPVTIKTMNRAISPDKFWRENQKIYVFDDPETEYQFTFDSIFPSITVQFSPPDGGVINGDNPTIHITYNVPVTIVSAMFNSTNIEDELIRIDEKSYLFTPSGYMENGTYPLEISAQALQGNGYLSSTAMYFYFSYEVPPQKSFLENNWLSIIFGGFLGGMAAILIFFRVKHVSIDGFIYLKNRKIIPFFKPIIVGPVSVRIPGEHLSKAEFYVDGQLKDETTTFPALWQWDEKAFMKHTLETKVYDEDGNDVSSGEMEFYIFNLSKNKGI